MSVRLSYGKPRVLYREPEGLLLQASLMRLGTGHPGTAALAFQLSYHGWGQITVDIMTARRTAGAAYHGEPPQSVLLHGDQEFADCDAWASVVEVGEPSPVYLRFTVLGQPGSEDPLRVRLDSEVTGVLPNLAVTTTMEVCAEEAAPARMRAAVRGKAPGPIALQATGERS
jgi:hypothetical protein